MKKIRLILAISLLIILNANSVFAGFGVSPPKVLNHQLLPGSRFEQTIYLVQSKPDKELAATVEIDAPEIEDWISIDQGLEFIIPAGVQQFPIRVSVDVPKEAEFKSYEGQMWIKTLPTDMEEKRGMVTVALGAIITFDLKVSTEEVYGFMVRGLSITNVEEGRPIKVGITLQNVGNVRDRPTKIHIDVYDQYHDKLLYSGDAVDLKYVEPFQTKTITGKFKAELAIGSYWADIWVYKDGNILVEDKRVFYVVERTGLLYKVFSHWYSWVILVVLILIGAALKQRKQLKDLMKIWRSKKRGKRRKRLEKKLRKLF